MDNSLQLNTSLRQQQTLAPLQLQFVRVLEMNEPELEEEVRRALDENPALEEKSVPEEKSVAGEEYGETAEQMQAADYSSEEEIPFYRLEARNRGAFDSAYEPVAVEHGTSLMEYLMSQLAQNADFDDEDMDIARYIAGNIDDNGYMTRSLREVTDDIMINSGLEVSDDRVRKVWNAVRALDPPGVGAMDLRDSLLLQLKRMPSSPDVKVAEEIMTDYFDVFSLMHFDRLRSMMNITPEQLRGALDLIKTLNPKPGTLISGSDDDDRLRHITPDFLVEPDGERFSVTLLSRIPGLEIEESFRADSDFGKGAQASEANAFIRKKRDEAATFIKVLDMRRDTLMKVMRAIVRRQQEFFRTDDASTLRPMILKDIAADTGYDLSVISRAASGKYVATHQGVYPLKFFFTERHKENEDISVQKVMAELKRLVESEDPAHPLTDEALTRQLKDKGYDIARRTVAKYREKLGIPVGRLRHRI
ncbi:MAG: RNA polymerase factor sigma-54 [Paramuribaculum sp.]|nr:RNA polymerase factor sigma-54 [Paramuribaculum sp.]